MDWTKIILAGVAAAISGVVASLVVRNRRERPFLYALVAAGFFIVLNGLSLVYLLPTVRAWQRDAQIRAASARVWRTVVVGDTGLSLSLPGPLEPQSIDIPDGARQVTSKLSVYKCDADGISIGVTEAIYAPGVHADLDGAINGALATISGRAGEGALTHSRTDVQIDGRRGALVRFQVRGGSETMDGSGLFLTEANHAWIVMIVYEPDQALGSTFASKVIASATLDSPLSTPSIEK
jgi:hypothetical protein